jgi:lipoprotein-anchoring transpeptidase ErfK/SrfK
MKVSPPIIAILIQAPAICLGAPTPLSPPPVVNSPSSAPATPGSAQRSTPPAPKPAPSSVSKSPAKEKTLSVKERDELIRLQIFLDSALFCPGKIDGNPGEFITKAVLRYQKAKGLPQTGTPENLGISRDTPIFSEYTIKPEDRKFIGGGASKHQSQYYIPYESYSEFLSERFHCSAGLLERLNPGLSLAKLKPGDTVKVPAVEPFLIEEVKSEAALPENPELKSRRVYVNRKERQLEVYEGEQLMASVPITPGSPSLPTPPGKWKIYSICTLPTFRWDEGVLNHGVRTNNFRMLPPGPNNPVGVVWCALNRAGIGIHGTNNPETIGRAYSHGCMRVANWDIVRVIQQVTAGIPVVIE